MRRTHWIFSTASGVVLIVVSCAGLRSLQAMPTVRAAGAASQAAISLSPFKIYLGILRE